MFFLLWHCLLFHNHANHFLPMECNRCYTPPIPLLFLCVRVITTSLVFFTFCFIILCLNWKLEEFSVHQNYLYKYVTLHYYRAKYMPIIAKRIIYLFSVYYKHKSKKIHRYLFNFLNPIQFFGFFLWRNNVCFRCTRPSPKFLCYSISK